MSFKNHNILFMNKYMHQNRWKCGQGDYFPNLQQRLFWRRRQGNGFSGGGGDMGFSKFISIVLFLLLKINLREWKQILISVHSNCGCDFLDLVIPDFFPKLILKELYVLSEELRHLRSLTEWFKCWGKTCTVMMCNQSHSAPNTSSFGFQQSEEIGLFCFHGSLS